VEGWSGVKGVAASTAVVAFAVSGAFAIWRVARFGPYSGIAIGVIAGAVGVVATTQVVPTKRGLEFFYVWIGLLWLCTVGLLAVGFAAGLAG
jgi:hypothetical protein